MADILWGRWQKVHIAMRHGVSAGEFDCAWHDPYRRDLAEHEDPDHGSYVLSLGRAQSGRS